MAKETIIGIDLGTTNSCVSIFENGQTRVIENSEGTRTTPSIVAYIKNNKKLVGSPAKNQRLSNPETTLYAVKRLIGREYNDKIIHKIKDEVSYKIVRSNNGDAWLQVENKKISPQEVSAEILSKMKETAEDFLGKKILSAVITVPAYFNDAQRQATKDAGKIAGLDVKRIINEPTAAALAYGLDKQKGDSIIAVYDLGGGTFDISIIEISDIDGEHQFEVLATNGDTFLGGEDFDMRIINYLIDFFKKNTSINLKNDSIALQRLKEAAEKIKIELSSQELTTVNLPYITADAQGPKHLTMDITRAKLESLVEDLIERTLEPCITAIKDSGKSKSDIDSVILVGGQTRMPKIQEIVKTFFNKTIKKDINPDEAVAIGAAIQGGVLSGDVKDVLLLDVTPLSLGIETIGGVMTKLIEKNTTIPTNKKQIFSTAADNQPAVTISVYQGEREQAVANQFLGKFDLTDIPAAPKGVPQIEVNFDIDANGILKVTAKNLSTNKEQNIVIKASGGLSDEQIKKMIKDAEMNAEADKKFKELVTVKNQADNILHTTQKALDKVGDSIPNEQKNKIEILKSKLKDVLNNEDKNIIESTMNELSQESTILIQEMYKKESETTKNDKSKDNVNDTENNSMDKKQDENIVDAEYEELKKNKDKKD